MFRMRAIRNGRLRAAVLVGAEAPAAQTGSADVVTDVYGGARSWWSIQEGLMVKHIVFWKLVDREPEGSKADIARAMKTAIEALKDLVPGVEHIEVGIDIEGSSAAWDVSLYSEFESPEALAAYQSHPEHIRVRDMILEFVTDRAVVDYED